MTDPLADTTVHDDAPITKSKALSSDGELLSEAVTVNRPAADLYAYWRETANLTQFMENVRQIDPLDANRSRWTVKAPAGQDVSWISIITQDVPDRAITWQSEDGADVKNSGRIEFHDAGARGTVVRAIIAYDPPGGAVGKFIAKFFQREPHIQTRRDLRRFKQLMETGEIATAARTAQAREQEMN